MKAIEADNEELRGVLPKDYSRIDNDTLVALLKTFSSISMDVEGDVFGKIYEYFLGKFAMAEGQRGGEFFTPTSLVKLIVEVIEPYHGRILDPACGSAGMFIQSANFVARHKKRPVDEIAVYGQEKVAETIRLSRMSLAVHGLSGDIKQGNSYYEDVHNSLGRSDFVMANPPFNVDGVDKEKLKNDKRYPFGIPTVDNAHYLWIQMFWSALNEKGRAGFVMANQATDSGGSELELRKKLVDALAVDVVIAIANKFFYTVTGPCTLWFLDKRRRKTSRADKVLFVDARHVYKDIDRAHREFSPDQIEFLANIVRLYRGEDVEVVAGSEKLMKEHFPKGKYRDVLGLCKVTMVKEIADQGYLLNPGRHVGVAEDKNEEESFSDCLQELSEEFESLSRDAHRLEKKIIDNVARLLVMDER